MEIFALLLAILAFMLFWLARRQQRRAGLPGGRIIYADTSGWEPLQEPLYDASLGLTGKPDYLVEKEGQIIPVEVKSTRIDQGPYDSHIYQLAAYCLLVERTYGTRPPYGILHYPNRTFSISFTPELESALLSLIEDIRRDIRQAEVHRSHEIPARCARCGFKPVCDQRLE